MLIKLTGNSLGERQRELNAKVNEAASNRVSFDDIKDDKESSDIEVLFKIDLASKYKNIDYIIDILKSGDSLYISRALKCSWMYEDEFKDTINVDYLQNNVIPAMSSRMKRKLLFTISTYVRDENRAAEFYKYCRTKKLDNIALKFLNFTNDNFKLEIIADKSNLHLITSLQGLNRQSFIRNSFKVAEAFVALFYIYNRVPVFRDISYLYTVSEEQYLDMLEQSVHVQVQVYSEKARLGARISKHIMKKHRARVLKQPQLYVSILNQSVMASNSTTENAKTYIKALIPEKVENFWSQNFCNTYKFIIEILKDEKFKYIKNLFNSLYPDEQFEMRSNFYYEQCYYLMTDEEKQQWALKQIESGNEILGTDKEYVWYKFVSFDRSFKEIIKYVNKTTDQNQRAHILSILLESAEIQKANPTIWLRHVEKILKYYYERHNNEAKYVKEKFLDKLLYSFDVYKFDIGCWTQLDKLFHSLDVYDKNQQFNGKTEYKMIALVYCIINKLEVHEALINEIKTSLYFYTLKLNTDKLSEDQQQMVYDFLFDVYMSEIRKHENVDYNDEVKYELRRYIHFILDLLYQYKKTKEDVPDLVTKFINLDLSEYEYHSLYRTDDQPRNLLRDLKKDAKLVVDDLPSIKTKIVLYNLSQLLSVLKTYFSDDIAKDFLDVFVDLLKDKELYCRNVNAATYGIFQLADNKFKTEFMKEYAPEVAKIDHVNADKNKLLIQQAICALSCYSRPPVALEDMLKYIKGDYVRFCLPTFQSYLASLPLPQCIEFVRALLDTPVSVQKHGIRLAFECFSVENLNSLVLNVWKETKNVSLRMVIYKALYSKVQQEISENTQDELFNTLSSITSTVNENDDKELFALLEARQFPTRLLSEYIRIVWKVVCQLPVKQLNLVYMHNVLTSIENNFNLLSSDITEGIINDFVVSLFNEEGAKKSNHSERDSIINTKWKLTVKYILHVEDHDLEKKSNLTQNLIKRLLESEQALKDKCFDFINSLEESSYYVDIKYFNNIDVIMKSIKKQLEVLISFEENYVSVWDLELGLATRKVIAQTKWEEAGDIKSQMKLVAKNFAEKLGNVIKNYIENGIYFASLFSDITSMIRIKIGKLMHKFNVHVKNDEITIPICLELIEIDKPEIYLLVINLLPGYYRPEYNGDFGVILDKIKKVDNKEIRLNLFRKFNLFRDNK
ncbi:unnamed protein product [Chrysodeixis includens]|uniref:Uncharacterized protein n=1 Tax=Chrysodeixis includens TaxID=689277 RepID=A0A9P0BW26_CHRIL|nr:unnamed protein product [Chrysodeixis includens]